MSAPDSAQVRRIAEQDLRLFTAAVLRRLGVRDADAEITAAVLTASDVRGIASHGVARLDYYVGMIERGGADPLAESTVIRESASTAVLDGQNGLGQPVAARAMALAIAKATAHDLGMVVVRNSNHYGIAGYYAMMALEQDMIGISLTNTHPSVAPTGSRAGMYGTNPIAIAVPTAGDIPFVLDMSTSVVPHGRLEVAARRGQGLAEGWALDALGRPTVNTADALDGVLLPLGGPGITSGYKGYGLALAFELLSAVLPGAQYGPLVHPFADWTTPSHLGHFFMAINVAAFDEIASFKQRAQDLLRRVKEAPLAEGAVEILVAGEKEQRAADRSGRLGVSIDEQVALVLEEMARRYGIPSPFPAGAVPRENAC